MSHFTHHIYTLVWNSLSVLCPNEIVTHFTHHIYTFTSNCAMKLVSTSYCFISLVTKWDCDLFHSFPLHISVKQFYQFGVQMKLWLISLSLSTLKCETVLSIWYPNEIVTHFTHHIYTLVLNSFISLVSKWDCDSFHSPYLHFHIQLCYEVGVHILLFYQCWWPNEIVTYFTHFLYTLVSNCLVLKW